MSPGEFRVWSISGGVLKPPTRPLNLSFFFFLRFWQCWVLTLTVLLHPRTPRTPPLVFLLAVTSSQMVVASFVWGLRTPPCSTELIPARNTNICCHYPDIRPHVYTIACRCRGDGERGCLFVNATSSCCGFYSTVPTFAREKLRTQQCWPGYVTHACTAA